MHSRISVIIPVYNTADYLNKCFTSVAAQSFKDFEVIIIDDGSADDSLEICNEWQKNDLRFKVFHQQNSGQAVARNVGIDIANGDYIAFIDSDDFVSRDYLKDLFYAAQESQAEIVICAYVEHRNGKETVFGPDENCCLDKNSALERLIEDDKFKSLCCARLFKKKLFDDIRFPVGRNYEDLATNYKLFDKASKVCSIDKPLYHYQIREGSMSFNDSSAEGWHDKCHSNVTSQIERTEYFRKKRNHDLADRSLAASVPYIYSDIMTGCQVGNNSDVKECREYLKKNRCSIVKNRYVSRKDKLLYFAYKSDGLIFDLLRKSKG